MNGNLNFLIQSVLDVDCRYVNLSQSIVYNGMLRHHRLPRFSFIRKNLMSTSEIPSRYLLSTDIVHVPIINYNVLFFFREATMAESIERSEDFL